MAGGDGPAKRPVRLSLCIQSAACALLLLCSVNPAAAGSEHAKDPPPTLSPASAKDPPPTTSQVVVTPAEEPAPPGADPPPNPGAAHPPPPSSETTPWPARALKRLTSRKTRPSDAQEVNQHSPPVPDFHVPSRDEIETETFGALSKLLTISLANTPVPLTVQDIDRLVGSPWSMKRSTAAKLRTLNARLRLMMFTTTAENLHGFNYVPNPNAVMGMPGWSTATHFLIPRNQSADALLQSLINQVSGHFRPEELIDFGVYTASQQPMFPRNQREWQEWERAYLKYNVWFAMAYLLTQLGQDTAQVQTGGYIPRISTRHLRVGWYGAVNRLGVSFKPTMRAGLRLAARGLDASTGLSGELNTPSQQLVMESQIREHLLDELGQTVGWDIALSAGARYVALHVDDAQQGKISGNLDWFAGRKVSIRHRKMSLLFRTTLASDIVTQGSSTVTASLEDIALGLSAALHVTVQKPWLKDPEYKAGAVIGGALLRSDAPGLEVAMQTAARNLRREMEDAKAWDRNLKSMETTVEGLASEGLLTHQQGREYSAFKGTRSTSAVERFVRLRQALALYISARDAYITVRGGCIGPSLDWCGTVEPDELQAARALVSSMASPSAPRMRLEIEDG